jgi:cytidylate kinase
MIISLTGKPGSGKSTVAALLSKKLGIPWFSIGDLRGQMAQERGMTLSELNKLGEKEIFTDKEVDDYQSQLGQFGKSFISDGKLAWHFIPHSFKVFLDVDLQEGARRIFQTKRVDESYPSVEAAEKALAERLASDAKRYKKYYNLDLTDLSHFDLIIDTTEISAEEVTKKILKAVKKMRKD